MSNQRRSLKKGFTLIELMVVIVIIGILAAIAIPKLFGMTAKAKASEVGPAVGTWSKLQQAYLMETGSFGSFRKIAYKAPGNTDGSNSEISTSGAFNYTGAKSTDWSISASEGGVTWQAGNFITLGDCGPSNSWQASFAKDSDSPTAASFASPDCEQLTPNFKNLK
jgi:prepilin-type N-terminal cleavage/methylation domain-containing protein